MRNILSALSLSATISGCAGLGSTHSARLAQFSHFEISTAELQRAGSAAYVLAAIQRTRPDFLRARVDPRGGPGSIVVYIDGSYAGDLSVLESLPVAVVAKVRLVRAFDAFTSTGRMRDVLEVTLAR